MADKPLQSSRHVEKTGVPLRGRETSWLPEPGVPNPDPQAICLGTMPFDPDPQDRRHYLGGGAGDSASA